MTSPSVLTSWTLYAPSGLMPILKESEVPRFIFLLFPSGALVQLNHTDSLEVSKALFKPYVESKKQKLICGDISKLYFCVIPGFVSSDGMTGLTCSSSCTTISTVNVSSSLFLLVVIVVWYWSEIILFLQLMEWRISC